MEGQFFWRILTESDMDEAKRFVYKYYSKQLPLAKIFRVKDEEIGRRNLEQTEKMVKNGTSFGCFHKPSNKLAAILQTSILVKDEPQKKLKSEENCSPELKSFSRFVDWMLKDICKELNAQKVLMLSCIAVADKFKRKRVSKEAGKFSRELAQRLDCEYEIALVANAHWAEAVAKHEQSLSTRIIAFCDYVDPETGVKPNLQLLPVHAHAKIIYDKVYASSNHSSKL